MKFTLALVTIFLMNIVSCVEEEDQVLVLEDKTFDNEIKNHDYLLIAFYAPWCKLCKSLTPEYAKAAEILRSENPPIYLAKVDATENNELSKRFSIEGFPTLKFYKMGEFQDYDGGRTHEEIVTWMRKKTGPPSTQLRTLEDIEEITEKNEIVCLLFGSAGTLEHKLFVNVAQKFDDVIFAHISSEKIAHYYGVNIGQILLFKKFDEEIHKYITDITEELLEQFLNSYLVPLISKFNDRIVEAIFGKNQIGFFFVRNSESAEQIKTDPIIRTISQKNRGKMIFVITDIVGELEEKFSEYLGISQKDLPLIRIIDVRLEDDIKTYAMEKEMTESNLNDFIQEFLDGKLKPFLKSEEIPNQQTGHVMKVVAKNFNEIVLNNDKHIFIMFYAPWCPHCDEFYPLFEQLASKYFNDLNIVFAKVDLTVNDIENVIVYGYPSLKLYRPNDKLNPIDYLKDRNYEELVKFVNGHLYPEINYNNQDNERAIKAEF